MLLGQRLKMNRIAWLVRPSGQESPRPPSPRARVCCLPKPLLFGLKSSKRDRQTSLFFEMRAGFSRFGNRAHPGEGGPEEPERGRGGDPTPTYRTLVKTSRERSNRRSRRSSLISNDSSQPDPTGFSIESLMIQCKRRHGDGLQGCTIGIVPAPVSRWGFYQHCTNIPMYAMYTVCGFSQ